MFSGDVAGSSNFVVKLAPTTSNRLYGRVGAVGDFGRRSFGRGSPSSGGRNVGKGSAMLAVLGFCLSHRHSWRRQCVLEDAPLEEEGSLHEMAGAENVILRHTPGNGMIADLGTKALAALKLEELKKAMGMTDRKIKTEKEKEDLGVVRGPTEEKEENGVVREPAIETKEAKGGIKSPKDMVRMAMIMAMLSRARAEDEDGDAGEESSIFFDMMRVYTIVVVLVTLAIQSGWQRRLLRAETAVGSDRSRGELAQRSARTSGLMTDGPTSVPGETVLGFGGGDQSRDELPGEAVSCSGVPGHQV